MTEALRTTAAPLVYLLSVVSFFLGLKSLAKVRTAGRGRPLLIAGLALAFVGVAAERGADLLAGAAPLLLVGAVVGGLLASRLPATPAPARLAFIPALAGAASAVVALGSLFGAVTYGDGGPTAAGVAVLLGGASALLGSSLALKGKETTRATAQAALTVVCAGWSAAALGLALSNVVMVVVGGLAGASGLALGRIVAGASGQTFLDALAGSGGRAEQSGYSNVRSCGTEEAAMILETARQVAVVPGFGMAAAHAQHAVKEMAELLEKRGTKVTWVIHPSAGCVPGHMNVALDEADVPRERVVEISAAGEALKQADVVLVVGANDVVNPAARDTKSPVYGLDAPDLARVRTVLVIKRSLRAGACGVKNPLFEQPNTTMVFGDAKKVAQGLLAELKGAGAH